MKQYVGPEINVKGLKLEVVDMYTYSSVVPINNDIH